MNKKEILKKALAKGSGGLFVSDADLAKFCTENNCTEWLDESSTSEEEKDLWDDIIQYFENKGYTDLRESDAKKIVSKLLSTYKIAKK